MRPPSPPPPTADEQAQWQQLVDYLIDCVRRSSVTLIPWKDKTHWKPWTGGAEPIIIGGAESVPVPGGFAITAPGSAQFGWPTALLLDRTGVPYVVPLLVVDLQSEGGFSASVSSDAVLNPMLVAGGWLPPEGALMAASVLAREGARRAIAVLVDALGVASDQIVGACSGKLNPRPGVKDEAVFIGASDSLASAAMLEELRLLRDRIDWTTSAAAALIRGSSSGLQRELETAASPVAGPVPLNASQESALSDALDSTFAVVTGPPGTGKSQLVVALAANAWLRDESLLLASTNNGAVDVAVEKGNQLFTGLFLRTGNSDQRREVATRVGAATTAAAGFLKADPPVSEADARARLGRAARHRSEVFERLSQLTNLDREMGQIADLVAEAEADLWPTPAVDIDRAIVCRRGSELASKRLFRRWRLKRFMRRSGVVGVEVEVFVSWSRALVELLDRGVERARLVLDLGDPVDAVEACDAEWRDASAVAVRVVAAARIDREKAKLSALALGPLAGVQFKKAVSTASKAIKGWACTALSAAGNFELTPGLFDHVVIDEASQCTLAAVLPLAYRAKRLTVVGDPFQLQPVVPLDDKAFDQLAVRHNFDRAELRRRGLDYGSGPAFAAFEHVVGDDEVRWLEEHYRCHPLIARWFNHVFYGDRLTVLTDISDLAGGGKGMAWIDVHGETAPGPSGSRMNEFEAEVVIEQLQKLVGWDGTIGVVTPFSAQADLIFRMATRTFGSAQLGAWDFVCGTSHKLQGDERDLVFFSSVVAPGIPPNAAKWVENQRHLINVAVSRARSGLVILGHPTEPAALGVLTLVSLRSAAIDGLPSTRAGWKLHSVAEKRLYEAMQDAGLSPVLKPLEEVYELDFALLPGGAKFNVEVDGHQHYDSNGRQRRQDIARDHVLRRLGWTVIRIPAWRALHEPGLVTQEIVQAVDTETARLRRGGEAK